MGEKRRIEKEREKTLKSVDIPDTIEMGGGPYAEFHPELLEDGVEPLILPESTEIPVRKDEDEMNALADLVGLLRRKRDVHPAASALELEERMEGVLHLELRENQKEFGKAGGGGPRAERIGDYEDNLLTAANAEAAEMRKLGRFEATPTPGRNPSAAEVSRRLAKDPRFPFNERTIANFLGPRKKDWHPDFT